MYNGNEEYYNDEDNVHDDDDQRVVYEHVEEEYVNDSDYNNMLDQPEWHYPVTNAEMIADWNTLSNDVNTWTEDDLQLAAELGKTLLERNKELEGSLRLSRETAEEQKLEITYLTKQTTALREVNESRLRCYESLEASINELEKNNIRLLNENGALKKVNKTICQNSEQLETKCDDLTKQSQDLNRLYESERRKNEKILKDKLKQAEAGAAGAPEKLTLRPVNHFVEPNTSKDDNELSNHSTSSGPEGISFAFPSPRSGLGGSSSFASLSGTDLLDGSSLEHSEELTKTVAELEAMRRQCYEEQQRVSELTEQLNSLIQENQALAERIQQTVTSDEMRSMHDELSLLDEVRLGKTCQRCIRHNVEENDKDQPEDELSMLDQEECDDNSMLELNSVDAQHTYRSAVTIKVAGDNSEASYNEEHAPSPNPYRDLVEKYEALLEVQRQEVPRNRVAVQQQQAAANLHDELTSGDFSSINTKDTDDAECRRKHRQTGATRKTCLRTPTDFSEAETSSSGFSDETSNKCTQTDETFLCTIADGEDKFSIYDEASPLDSRFRNRPEYRELFKEIFAILKKAAENKDEGEKLPLLDDSEPGFKVPPVTPAVEELPAFPDETESIMSSIMSEQSVAMSERITKQERKTILDTVKKHVEKNGQENKPPIGKQILEDGRVLTPYKRQPLEYLAVSVNIRKKNRKKARGSPLDRSDSPVLPSPPRVFYTSSGKKRRDMRSTLVGSATSSPSHQATTSTSSAINNMEWNGSSMTIYNRNVQSPSGAVTSASSSFKGRDNVDSSVARRVEFKRTSTASQDLHKLMKLDLSYAEVLRRADTNKQMMLAAQAQQQRKH